MRIYFSWRHLPASKITYFVNNIEIVQVKHQDNRKRELIPFQNLFFFGILIVKGRFILLISRLCLEALVDDSRLRKVCSLTTVLWDYGYLKKYQQVIGILHIDNCALEVNPRKLIFDCVSSSTNHTMRLADNMFRFDGQICTCP